MAFWGVEVKPSRPYSHRFDTTRGRLHVSQATLGNGTSLQKCSVQCTVRNKNPVLLCSLVPEKTESCSLDLEFEDDDNNVVFSVIGPRSVHIAGYYLSKSPKFHGDNSEDSDSYGEVIGESENSTDCDTDEDNYEDDFIDDADLDTPSVSPSPSPNSKVIEEISLDEKLANGNGGRKRLKKKYQVSDSDGDYKKESIIGGGSSIFESESEDEDALPISFLSKTKDESAEVQMKSDNNTSKRSTEKSEFNSDHVTGAKRKHPYVQEGETKRESCEAGQEDVEKPKKKKKKKKKETSGGDSNEAKATDDTLHEVEGKQSLSNMRNVEEEEEDGTERKKKNKKKKKKTDDKIEEKKTHGKRKKVSSGADIVM